MPHLTLEYSTNLPESTEILAILERLHDTLASLGPFRLEDIKSRAIAHDRVVVGHDAPGSGFAHLTVSILSGRDLDVQREVSARMLSELREAFAQSFAERPCSLTVEIREMRRETYGKIMNDLAQSSAP